MIDAAAMAADPLAALQNNARIYIVPEWKIMFSSVAKNACTTLKWMMAEIAGEDLSTFHSGIKPYPDHAGAVHTRELWKRALTADLVPAEVRKQIHPDNGWLLLAVVRDPRARLFSAWQDKLLLANSIYDRWRGEPWYPGSPDSAEDIVASFGDFVRMLQSEPDHKLLKNDTHFRPQVELTREDIVPYHKIYEIREMGALRDDVQKHLDGLGWTRGEIVLRRSNDTPLRANAALFPDDIQAAIADIYAVDFERYGDRWDFSKIESVPDWTPSQIHEIGVRRELGERLAEMRALALAARRHNKELRAVNSQLREQLESSVARQAYRRVRSRFGSR